MDELVHGQQLDGRDAEREQVVDDGGVGEAGVRAALVLGHFGVTGGEALDVDLVDHRIVQRDGQRAIVAPVEVRAVHDRARHVRRAVVVVA